MLLVIAHRSQQSLVVDERQQDFPKPSELLAGQIDFKLSGEVVSNRGINVGHDGPQMGWQNRCSFGRQDSHELLVRFERLSKRKLLRLCDIKIGEEG